MTLNTIFIPAVDETSFRLSFERIIPFAQKHSKHIFAMHVMERYPVAHVAEFYWHEDVMRSHDANVKALAERLESVFYEICRDQHIDTLPLGEAGEQKSLTASWACQDGRHYFTLAYAARQSDIIFLTLPSADPTPSWQKTLIEEMLTISGVSVMLCPEEAIFSIPKKILIAWNGGMEARRALLSAEPILKKAQEVRLVSIGQLDPDPPSAQDMAIFLNRKGIKATGEYIADGKTPIKDHLMSVAQEMNADLLVMGAYSHPKWRELILGGVTRSMLNPLPLPVLMAH